MKIIKKLLSTVAVIVVYRCSFAQTTNTFPSSGNVGIGTTNPIRLLEVVSGAGVGPLKVAGPNGYLLIDNVGSGESYYQANSFHQFQGSSGTPLMTIFNNGNVGIGAPSTYNGTPSAYSTLTVGSTDATAIITPGGPNTHLSLQTVGANGAIRFFTIGGSTNNVAPTESMRISAGGNVGIGTTTPPTVGNYGVLALNGRSASQGGYLSLMTNGTETGAIAANTQLNINAASGIVTQFYTGSTPTLQISSGGNVLINQISQANTGYKLDVNGSIRSNAVVVNTSGADFVFNRNYHLNSLGDLEQYIEKNHHLPEIKSAEEMQKEGMNVGELNTKLLQKVEELTLYLIEKDKQLSEQQKKSEQQDRRIAALESALSKLISSDSNK